VVKRALTLAILATAIQACGGDDPVAPEGTDALAEGLIASYRFTSDATDSSGNGHDGTLVSGATAAGALEVAATDEALELPSTVVDGLTDFTVAAWVQIDVVQAGSNQFLSGANASQDNAFGLYYQTVPNEWNIQLDGISDAYGVNDDVEDGGWHHVAFVRSGTTATAYVDGTSIGSAVVSSAALDVDSGGLFIGQDQDVLGGDFDSTQSWAGLVDNLRFYDRALGQTVIDLLVAEGH